MTSRRLIACALVVAMSASATETTSQAPDTNCLPPSPTTPNYPQAMMDYRRRMASIPRAPPGSRYEYGSCTPTPIDACMRAELRSPGAVANLNHTLGAPTGVPAQVEAVADPRSAEPGTLSAYGIRVPVGPNAIACHATLKFVDGRSQGGVFSIIDPGQYAPLQVAWLPDTQIASRIAISEHLASATHLNVKPDLRSPQIQACVGAKAALGSSEQFDGQYWAACAAERDAAGAAPAH